MFFKDLFKHMYWADAVGWQAIFATPQTEDDARLRELLYHIHLTQNAFLSIWRRQRRKNLSKYERSRNLPA